MESVINKNFCNIGKKLDFFALGSCHRSLYLMIDIVIFRLCLTKKSTIIISSPEPLGSQGELVGDGHDPASARRPSSSIIFKDLRQSKLNFI